MSLTDDPEDPRLGYGVDKLPTVQNEVYLVLSEEERAKGFVRPYREAYTHVGIRPKYPLVPLTEEETKRFGSEYKSYEKYPDSCHPLAGRYWSEEQLTSGCGGSTIMGKAIAETYARDPKFYGSTYCCVCMMHKPVREFVWGDGKIVGS